MRLDKINFVYHTPKCLGSGYMGSEGLFRAIRDYGYLNYAFNQTGDEFLDIEKYQSVPIFMVRGFLEGRMPLVARAGNQFRAAWQSESYYTRRGEIDKNGEIDSSTPPAVKNQKHFNMYFTCAETDLGMYDIPTYWLPSWADTTVFKPTRGYLISDRLGFYGGKQGREDFLTDDLNMIEFFRTPILSDAYLTAVKLCECINKYEMLISPPGRCFNGMCGRAFEIMACGRLCFQYLNENTMFKHMEFFKDGEDIVYFHDKDELREKWKYYLSRPDERRKIAYSGYLKVKENHNEKNAVKRIISCMEKEYLKWKKEQDSIPEEINEIYAGL